MPGGDEVTGPRTWVVLAGTAVAAVLVVGAILGWRAWQDRDEDPVEAVVTDPPTLPPAVDDPVAAEGELFRRTTDAGIEVRARLTDMVGGGIMVATTALAGSVPPDTDPPDSVPAAIDPEQPVATVSIGSVPPGLPRPTAPGRPGPPGDQERPAFCNVVGDLTAWAIGEDSVVQGGGPWTEAAPSELAPSLMWDGRPGGSIMGAVLQVDGEVVSVRMTGPDGALDEMEPIDGAAVVAVEMPADFAGDPFDQRQGNAFVVTARRADGTTMRADNDIMMQGHPAWSDPQCVEAGEGPFMEPPMPELEVPAPGSEQPADPAAAQAEIEATFGSLYGRRDPPVDRNAILDDPYGIDALLEQIGTGDLAEAAADSSVEIVELVYTSATDAVFTYELTAGGNNFGVQLGRARLLDGVWKISRSTYCQDLGKAGVMCPP